LTAFLAEAAFELVPVFARRQVIGLLCQYLHHVHHRKPPGFSIFVIHAADGLTIELSRQDFHGPAPWVTALALRWNLHCIFTQQFVVCAK